ncbi:acetyl-CoA synthetase-like protein, partial [Delitschia confertaspora ATCC 74209]
MRWLSHNTPPQINGLHDRPKPVALFMESDLGLFIYLSALLWMKIPVLLLSARLGPAAITHLLSLTEASKIVVSKRTKETAARSTMDISVKSVLATSYASFLRSDDVVDSDPQLSFSSIPSGEDKSGSLILHSSGTTGLPKPIYLTQRYVLGYAACHRLAPEDADGRLNVSTLPLYHGFGLLAPALSLSVGKPCCFPASSIIPSASSTLELLRISGACSLMSVPSVIEEIVTFPDPTTFQTLAPLDFVAIGGGAIKLSVGEALYNNGVKLLNHYGATEIGAIAPIFVPGPDYDWRYLRLRSDMGLQLHNVDSEDGLELCKLVGFPFGWNAPFEIQDLLERNPAAPGSEMEVRILGRKDDVIVLTTGEKVLPQIFEETLNGKEPIKAAVVYGAHRESVGILIEPKEKVDSSSDQTIVDTVWSWIDEINKQVDRHARVPSSQAIIIVSAGKVIPRSDKGSVMRNEVERIFKDEIEAAYQRLDNSVCEFTDNIDPNNPEIGLRSLVQSILSERMDMTRSSILSNDTDFFELGMDSLEATRLARRLNTLHNRDVFFGLREFNARPDFVYRHPTISALSAAITRNTTTHTNRGFQMQTLLKHSLKNIRNHVRQNAVVLLTGSTGSLGTNVLDALCRDVNVKTIICLNRPGRDGQPAEARQQQSCISKGVHLPPESQEKVQYIEAKINQNHFGLKSPEGYEMLVSKVTHIIHNAWPMDFKRQLKSFSSQIQATENLIKLALDIHRLRPQIVPKLVFTSSIAVTGRYPSRFVPEEGMKDPRWAVPMGYSEAKWVCEGLIVDSANSNSGWYEPVVVRVGQLSGSTQSGYWSKSEHFPVLVSASKAVGSMPDLSGTYSWLPVDTAAQALSEIALFSQNPTKSTSSFYHLENPVRQPWKDLLTTLCAELNLGTSHKLSTIPFNEWMKIAKSKTDLVAPLEEFFREDFLTLSSGKIVLGTEYARSVSRVLGSVGGIGEGVVRKYIRSWKDQ